MRPVDLVGSAITNTLRSKTRTLLTILAIFVGAFTLTLTSGLGTGINRYIDATVAGLGASDVMTVTKNSDTESQLGFPGANSPIEYNADAVIDMQGGGPGPGGFGQAITVLTPEDIETLQQLEGVLRVVPTRTLRADFVQSSSGTKWVASVGTLIPGQTVQLAAGEIGDESNEPQLVIPVEFVEPLGFTSSSDALGKTITIGISDGLREQHTVTAKIQGVAENALAGIGSSLIPNNALADELWRLQNTGIGEEQQDRFASASLWFPADASEEDIATLETALTEAGFTGTTITDQLGMFKAVIDAIVLVLNAFAAIALLAASFGIVNTLFMSVQERTREIGLMKAMGMGPGRIFTLFSLEAVFIGFLASIIGAGVAIVVGTGVSGALSTNLFADLPGLDLIAFDLATVAIIVFVVMGISFLAATLPAARAAKKDPVDALRYE